MCALCLQGPGEPGPAYFLSPRLLLLHPSSSLPPPSSHLLLPPQGKILVGTRDGEIIEVGEKNAASNLLLDGHSGGGVWGVATHPNKELCVTAGDDATIRLWKLIDKV